jgi:hypothetical protein
MGVLRFDIGKKRRSNDELAGKTSDGGRDYHDGPGAASKIPLAKSLPAIDRQAQARGETACTTPQKG